MEPLSEHTVVSVKEVLLHFSQDRYLDKKEAASYTSLSTRNLEARLSEIPHFRVGQKILFKKSEIDRWMEAHRVSNGDSLSSIADDVLEALR